MALVGLPFYATYAATKAGVAHFAEALRRELYGEGVKVMTVYPGATSTPMMEARRPVRTRRAGPHSRRTEAGPGAGGGPPLQPTDKDIAS